MEWVTEQGFERLITQAEQFLSNTSLLDYDVKQDRALIEFDGIWNDYRIIVSEVHRRDRTVRYAYCVLLSENNMHIHRFDNSGDRRAVKLRYGSDWKSHQHEEIPHQHDAKGKISLTSVPMTFETFIEWLGANFPSEKD